MKKAKIVLAMLLALSVFSFAGCGNNDDKNANNDASDNTTVQETTDNAATDIKDDVEDLGDDVKDGAEDMLNGTDNTKDGTQKNATTETTK